MWNLPAIVGKNQMSGVACSPIVTNPFFMTRPLSILMSLLIALNTNWAGSVCASTCCPDEVSGSDVHFDCSASDSTDAETSSSSHDAGHEVPSCDDECCAPLDELPADAVERAREQAEAITTAHSLLVRLADGCKVPGLMERNVPLRSVKTHVLFCTFLC